MFDETFTFAPTRPSEAGEGRDRPHGALAPSSRACCERLDGIDPLDGPASLRDGATDAIDRTALDRDGPRQAVPPDQARRLQAIGSMASGIAHNFNNILSAILGYSEMVETHLAHGTKPAQHLVEIRRAAERGRDLVDSILTLGRPRDVCFQRTPVHVLLAEAAALLHASLPCGVDLVVGDVPGDLAVSGAPAQLQQIILNLCTNAAQAMRGKGCIRLTAERMVRVDFATMSHGDLTPGDYVRLAVADTGQGFDDRVARRLFEAFFTTRTDGTGLGLATVQAIVREHGGAMHVESRPGEGSRFEAWLPVAAAEGGMEIEPECPHSGRGETVLVIDGDRQRRLRLEDMLAALGYEPEGFERAADAVAACRAAPHRFDMILVSQGASDAAGLERAHALHRAAPRLPLLLAVASTAQPRADALAEAGICDVLRMPLTNAALARALARWRYYATLRS